jgi:hypothetical protein
MSFGFVITRYVHSIQTNKYWNHSVKLLRILYPLKKIIIIDDNSKQEFIKADYNYKNVEIIQSEYPGRGELLPFIYFLKYKWFDHAVILHDSVFIHKKILFHKITEPVVPLWHFNYDKENIHNILRISSGLKNNYKLTKLLTENNTNMLGMPVTKDFICCFGAQAYISHSFLVSLENKYAFTNLVNLIKTKTDRCALERLMGLLFSVEHPSLLNYKSILGNIMYVGNWGYTYDQYEEHFNKKKIIKIVVKVWSGR